MLANLNTALDLECDITDNASPRDTRRPPSRLGYNSNHTPTHTEPEPVHKTETTGNNMPRKRPLLWTNGFLQRVKHQLNPSPAGPSDRDDDEKHVELMLGPPSPTETVEDLDMDMDIDLDDLSSISTTDDSDSEDSEDQDSSPFAPPMVRASAPEPEPLPEAFRILYDSISPESVDATLPTSPVGRKIKFTRCPSPLSSLPRPSSDNAWSSSTGPSPKTPSRHLYTHHGYSRHALHHIRSFWSNRRDEWTTRTTSDELFGDMPSVASRTETDGGLVPVPPSTIHPRTGDISGLRDIYCAHADMCLAALPMWTIGKILWMSAVHAAIHPGFPATDGPPTDAMLVQSPTILNLRKVSGNQDGMDVSDQKTPISGPPSTTFRPAWATTANARWDLLFQMVYHQPLPEPTREPRLARTKTPRFFLGDIDEDGEDWFDERGMCMDVDDEDDYGILVPTPVFRRARTFDAMVCV